MEVFDDTFVPPGLAEVMVRRCPRCIWPYLRTVQTVDQTHLLCESCGHCWRLEHGNLRPVNVLACDGCAARTTHECITLMHDEFWRFGTDADAAQPE